MKMTGQIKVKCLAQMKRSEQEKILKIHKLYLGWDAMIAKAQKQTHSDKEILLWLQLLKEQKAQSLKRNHR